MKFASWWFATAVMAAVAVSCTENKPAENKPETGSLASGHASAAKAAPAVGDVVVPPKDAQWTIYCMSISGDNHVLRARKAKNDLIAATPLKEWYVVHGEAESTLFYGFYRTISETDDAKEATRAHTDRQRIKSMMDPEGRRPFQMAIFVRQDLPDPTAPPEWDLTNAKGFYSLEIAVYKDSPDRKKVALETVRAAREMGVEAYYYHGPSTSSVCIGVWPREAVREENVREVVKNEDPNRPMLVLPQAVNNMDAIQDDKGNVVQAVAPKVEPIDPTLIAAMKQYPDHTVNGSQIIRKVRDPKTGQVVQGPEKSFLVVIPRKSPSILGGPTLPPTQEQAPVAPPVPEKPVDDGRGKLKSIGD